MAVSKQTVMVIKSYQNQAEMLVKNHLLADPVIPYTSIIAGILGCKVVYDLTQLFSAMYFKSYAGLNKVQRIEWNNRGISTVHAIFIAAMSLYFVYWSDLYADYKTDGFVTFRNSTLSNFTLGAEDKPYLPCVNHIEVRFYTGELRTITRSKLGELLRKEDEMSQNSRVEASSSPTEEKEEELIQELALLKLDPWIRDFFLFYQNQIEF